MPEGLWRPSGSTQDRQIGTVTALKGMESANGPQNWRIKVSQQHIELYVELVDQARPLIAAEARMMVELVDAWRELEHRKHIALKHAMERR
jgi:hypothetical protein